MLGQAEQRDNVYQDEVMDMTEEQFGIQKA